MTGFLCPAVMSKVPGSADDCFGDDLVVLLAIWKTRCESPYIEGIFWIPNLSPGLTIRHARQQEFGKLLNTRYCDFDKAFDVNQAYA